MQVFLLLTPVGPTYICTYSVGTYCRVSDPDPDWIRIQSGQWIRIQESKIDPQK
jgi:hypothetical protein